MVGLVVSGAGGGFVGGVPDVVNVHIPPAFATLATVFDTTFQE